MHVEQQQVLLRSQAQQLHPQQWTRLEVEGPPNIAVGDLARTRLRSACGSALRSVIGNASAPGGSITCSGSSALRTKRVRSVS